MVWENVDERSPSVPEAPRTPGIRAYGLALEIGLRGFEQRDCRV